MNTVTLGGAGIGLAILLHRGVLWWPGLKALTAHHVRTLSPLLPFVFSWCVGALLVMSAGGLFGYAADWTLWGSNWLGDGALVYGIGGRAGDDVTRRGPQQALTNGGHLMVLLMVVGWAAARTRPRVVGMLPGLLSGVLLGLSGGVLGKAAVPLASGVNWIGSVFATTTLGG